MAFSSSQDLTQQFDDLMFEYSTLKDTLSRPPSYESLTENTNLIHKIDQWETDTIRQVKETAEQIREKIRRRSDTIATDRFTTEFQQLTEQLQHTRQTHNFTESRIQQLTTQLNDLKLQVDDSLLTTAEIRIVPIDWTKYLYIVNKPQQQQQQQQIGRNQRTIYFDRLTTIRPQISLDVKGAEWHILGTASSPNSTFLHYQHSKKNKRLSIVDFQGQQKTIPWHEDQSIWDSCWSSFLNKFIILGDNRLYTYDDNDELTTSNSIKLIKEVKPRRNNMEFLRCFCSNETLFITYDERNTSIDEYNMNQWTMSRTYENIIKQNEIIISITISVINPNLIGLIILDDKQQWHFELRDRSMTFILSIQLDKSEFNRRLISLPNSSMNWLIIHTGSKFFTIIDENAQTKEIIECAENIDLATYIPDKHCLVTLTQKSKLKFFDL
ncbi:unnamed protein product [Adineta steineri]|uniref:Uncharacterized protein n=1 Tax=Adineta steineri TaxID=433720 RepID=A0A813VLY4_9BILA|nr:unnamed protein product [Adineta steineri]CAF3922344.1 unnamed protein product [Adineta steineri]